ncbi:MAG: glycosyltransferase family 4 protein [Chloroflexi bacterium]|nr:glycosyltransferase family 4 protein [Chloroflexota bacterium]
MRPKSTMSRRALPLARALVRRGHQVRIIVPPWDYPDDAGRREVIDGVEVANLDLPRAIPGLWYGMLTGTLVSAALDFRPDVIHTFKPKAFAGAALAVLQAMKAACGLRARLVLDTDDWERAWNDVNPYPWWQRAVFTAQEETLLRSAEAVTTASQELARMAADRRDGRGVYYLPNGVGDDTASDVAAVPSGVGAASDGGDAMYGVSTEDREARRLVVERHGLGPGALILLYTRFVEYGMERLAEMLRAIGRRTPGATLLVVGTGLLQQERDLAEMAQRADLGVRIVQVGWVRQSDLPTYFGAADLAIFPMDDTLLNRTKCPMKLVDLLAAGVPVVAERIGQIGEYIEDGDSGLLVESGDHEAFAGALGRLLNDPTERRRMGENARRRMAALFSWDRLSEQAERAYRGQRPLTWSEHPANVFQEAALKRSAGVLDVRDYPEWATPEKTSAWVREMRRTK